MTKGLNEVIGNLKNWESNKIDALEVFARMESKKAEAFGKQSRVWVDQTADARRGLTGDFQWFSMTKLMIIMKHTVTYGVFLELCNDGKYAILEKSLESIEEEFIAGVKRIMRT